MNIKHSTKKIIYMIIIMIIITVSLIRYYNLNRSFKVKDAFEKEIYTMNSIVETDENKCNDFEIHPGLTFEITNSEIYEFNKFQEKYNINEIPLDNRCKILEVSLRITNITDLINSIRLNFFEVVGTDWYATLDYNLTYSINEFFYENCREDNLTLALNSKSSFEVKMIYILDKARFSENKFKNLYDEKMYFELTILPVNKLIEFR